jgi:Fic family protein
MNDHEIFEALGFRWDREEIPENLPAHPTARVLFRFQKSLPEFVWDAAVLEGNPFTFPEVKTLVDGITVGGHKLSDAEQILNLIASSKYLLESVSTGLFKLDKHTFCALNEIVARNEALEWGHFRGEGTELNYSPYVALGEAGRYEPARTEAGAPALNDIFERGIKAISELKNPFEAGAATFLFGALQQFFFDGNKRTARFMMNGTLMSAGIDAISIPAAQGQAFNEKMVRFYVGRDATEMMEFLVECHPEAQPKHQALHGCGM